MLSRSSARARIATLLGACSVALVFAAAIAGILHAPSQIRAVGSFREVEDSQAETDAFRFVSLKPDVFRALRRLLPEDGSFRLELAGDTAFDPVRTVAIRSLTPYWLYPRDSRGETEPADAVVRFERGRVLIRYNGRVVELPSAFVGERR